jgi:hypothetical protein
MSSIESTPTFPASLVSNRSGYTQSPAGPQKRRAYAAAIFARLRDLAPYAALELVLPGGSVLALVLWLYRRTKKAAALRASAGELSGKRRCAWRAAMWQCH